MSTHKTNQQNTNQNRTTSKKVLSFLHLGPDNPVHLFIFVSLAIFFVEMAIMLSFQYLFIFSHLFETFIDSFILILIMYPVLLYFVFKPLTRQNLELATSKFLIEREKIKKEAILTSVGDGFVVVDNEGKIIEMSNAAGELLGVFPPECKGKPYNKIWLMRDKEGNNVPEKDRPIQIVLRTGKKIISDISTDFYYVRKDGVAFPVEITVSPVILEEKIIGVVDVFRDITKDKEIDKAKTEFVSLVSHQLRTPLTAINWYAEMILNGDAGEVLSKQKEYLQEIYTGNQRMIKLVNTLLDVSRLELGTFVIQPEPVQFKDVAESVFTELTPQITSRKLTINKQYEPSLPIISADPQQTRMIFQNLLGNAVKYVEDGGEIRLSIFAKGRDILIEVWNSGGGIPFSAQPKIFTKLFRDELAKQKNSEGNGLGLYIVKSVVEKSGGKIWFKSGKKEGTTFYVSFPLVSKN
ncbi:MAG: PAS domain-containing sensor histidine kinase [Candidatus Paceibacterota bacterium]|jgi:PAS domain S-box-containing protein